MKKALVVILAICLIAGFAYGQDKKYGTALFRIVGQGDVFGYTYFGDYNGGFGFQINLGPIAVRPMVMFVQDATDYPSIWDPTWSGDYEKDTSFGFGLDLLYYITQARLATYLGIGVGFGSMTALDEYDFDPTAQPAPDWDKMTGTMFLVRGVLGFEFWIVKGISFGGEYAFGFTSYKTKMEMGFGDGTPSPTPIEIPSTELSIYNQAWLIITVEIM